MRKHDNIRALLFCWIISVACILIFSGCKTTPQVDWQSRVGQWTYDEVVKDLGPADKRETLSDGTIVAEWMVQRGTSVPRYEIVNFYDDYWFPQVPAYNPSMLRSRFYQGYRSEVYFPGSSVRLIFNPQGMLENAKYFSEQ